MRYRLRTLLIVLALGPMVLAGVWQILKLIAIRDEPPRPHVMELSLTLSPRPVATQLGREETGKLGIEIPP